MDEETRKEYLRKHYMLWNWLVEHPRKYKDAAFEALGFDSDYVFNDCYLCEIDIDTRDIEGVRHCTLCPLRIACGESCYDRGWYSMWKYAQHPSTRKKYAILIRDVVPRPEGV